MKQREFWFVVGSQFLYGPEVLETVAARGAEMARTMSESGNLPCPLVYKATVKTDAEITQIMREANYDDKCCGVVTWCHTFSPSKMWIHGFDLLQKPYCHLATQYNRKIPNESGCPRRPGAWIYWSQDAPPTESCCRLLAGQKCPAGIGRLDAGGYWL